jgi:hypothetical protein
MFLGTLFPVKARSIDIAPAGGQPFNAWHVYRISSYAAAAERCILGVTA